MRHGRLRWFEHLDRKSVDDWVTVCREVEVAGVRCRGRNRKTWKECVDNNIEVSRTKLAFLAQTPFSPRWMGLGLCFRARWIGGVKAHLFCIGPFALTSLVFEI